MGLVEIEKKSVVKIDGMSTDEQVQHLGTLGDENLGSLNLAPTTYDFSLEASNSAGMALGHIKKETGVLKICFNTLFLLTFIIGITALVGFLAIKIGKLNFHIFPKLDSYNLEQYNTSVKRCFLILSGMLLGTCIIILFVYNLVVKSRFINNYLNKIGIYIYSIFAVIVNCSLYVGVMYSYFFIVNKINANIKGYIESGIITEKVNVSSLELFKYAIVIFCVIFLVANSFSIVGIIKEKNKFVFEEV